MDKIPIKDTPHLVRDRKTSAVINTNKQEQKRIQDLRAKKRQQVQDVENLKKDVGDMKLMLSKVLNLLENNN